MASIHVQNKLGWHGHGVGASVALWALLLSWCAFPAASLEVAATSIHRAALIEDEALAPSQLCLLQLSAHEQVQQASLPDRKTHAPKVELRSQGAPAAVSSTNRTSAVPLTALEHLSAAVQQLALAEVASSKGHTSETVSRSKNILLFLEATPPLGLMGIDRFYLGNNIPVAFAKLIVCICTCGIGGLVWGLIDFCAVMINAITLQTSIDILGMQAHFFSDVHTSFILACAILCFWFWCGCCGVAGCASFLAWGKARDKATSWTAPFEAPVVGYSPPDPSPQHYDERWFGFSQQPALRPATTTTKEGRSKSKQQEASGSSTAALRKQDSRTRALSVGNTPSPDSPPVVQEESLPASSPPKQEQQQQS